MITLELATRLKEAGLEWQPASGDRFAIPIRGLDHMVFVVSEMIIDTQVLATGSIVRFNGSSEWALDSIPQDEVVWLPGESQLRDALGPSFQRMEAVPGGFVVVVEDRGRVERHIDVDAERAYARAVLARLAG